MKKEIILFPLMCLCVGYFSSLISGVDFASYYSYLNKPAFSPPSFIFAPVWTILYILMGLSFYYIWKRKNRKANMLFYIQLFLNFLWSPIFFGLGNIFLAAIIIILLDIFVAITISRFYKLNKKSAYLMVPYFLWLIFATVLNFSILILN